MTRRACQHRLVAAERHLADANANLHASMRHLRLRMSRHGPFAVLGAGVVTGAAASVLPLGKIARMLASATLLLLRIPANAWIGALRMHDRTPPTNSTQ